MTELELRLAIADILDEHAGCQIPDAGSEQGCTLYDELKALVNE